jgi:hypothetical protein
VGSTSPALEVISQFEKRLWETAFAQVATGGNTEAATLIALTLAALPTAVAPVLPCLKDFVSPVLPVFVRLWKEQAGAGFSVMAPQLKILLKNVFGRSPAEVRILLGGRTKEKPQVTQAPDATKAALEDGLYVDNAGLVILHPFLQRFLEGLGIAQEGVLLQPDRALHLLHYLCTGHTPAPEYELTLPKILCNIPLKTPVEADITLTDREKEEAMALLEAAIRWWDALRNTGADALRGTFLCRPGKLSRREDGDWLLQVERQGFDVLLDQLPWGISVLRLAWMEGMLWVEWG